jgi:hypothetical protein
VLTALRRRRRASEHGAAAVVSVLCALICFGFAALIVDLGNAMARKGDTQAEADFAALAGAQKLTGKEAPGQQTASDDAVKLVAEYLVSNFARDDAGATAPSVSTMAQRLVNSDPNDGQVQYLGGGRMRVTTPRSQVNFGFAGVFSMFGTGTATNVKVVSGATSMIGTPKGNNVWPMYVATPSGSGPDCDYGLQTLTDPPGGHVVPPTVPTLYADSDTNESSLSGIAVQNGTTTVSGLDQYAANGSITLTGSFKDATRVGFFRSDSSSTAPVEVRKSSAAEWLAPTSAGAYTASNGQVTVKVPASVTASDILWYVRVYQSTTTKWSARSEALPLSVGDAPFECVGGSQSGNFGTLKMPRSDVPSLWIPLNIATGVQAPITLTTFPSPAPWECSTDPRSVISTASDRRPGTNCLDTDTGLTAQTATDGFITGIGTQKGLLNQQGTSSDPDGSGGCAPDGTTNPITILGKQLNNDLLTCFLTDNTTTLGTVARANYSGGPRFTPDIYNSPRFAWVPVFAQETQQGGSNKYSIVGFRPTFLTDQPMTATKANNAVNGTTQNGLGMSNSGNQLETIKVVFLNAKALPDGDADTPIGPYLGPNLPKAIRLID